MALNLSDFDYITIYRTNPVLHVFFFVILCIPALFLNLLCALALLLSRSAHINIKIILLNIFASEIAQIVGTSVLLVGHPARIHDEETINYSCNFAFSALFCGGLVKLLATTLYAIAVYIHIQYGRKKLKCRVVIACCVIIWVASILVFVLPYTTLATITSNHGFCYTTYSSIAYQIMMNVTYGITAVLSTILTVGFAIRSFCYVKRNTMQGHNESTHKAVKNMLLFLIIGIFISLINYMLEPAIFQIIKVTKSNTNTASLDLALYYIFNGLFISPVVLTPIFTIILLKPVRETLKRLFSIRSRNSQNPLSPTYLDNMMDTEQGSRTPHLARTITVNPNVGPEFALTARPRPVIRFNLPADHETFRSIQSPKPAMDPSGLKPLTPEPLSGPKGKTLEPAPATSLEAPANFQALDPESVVSTKPALDPESIFSVDSELEIVAVKREVDMDDSKACDNSTSSEFTVIYRRRLNSTKGGSEDLPQSTATDLSLADIELEVVETNPKVSSNLPSSEFVVIYKPAL